MYEEILNEILSDTRVAFSPAGIQPLSFLWSSRNYVVRRINARWVDRTLTPPRHGFSVTVHTGEVFQLSYTEGESFWRLDSILNEA